MALESGFSETNEQEAATTPQLREHNEELRAKNPGLFENLQKKEAQKEQLARVFAERIRDSGMSPDDYFIFLSSAHSEGLDQDLTSVEGWNPELVLNFGQPRIKVTDYDTFPVGFKPNTLKLGIDLAHRAGRPNGEEIVRVPYPSFAPSMTPQEKLAGAKVTQVAYYDFNRDQIETLTKLVNTTIPTLKSDI